MFSLDTHREAFTTHCQHPISNNDKGEEKRNETNNKEKEDILKGRWRGDRNENGERKCAKTKNFNFFFFLSIK